MGILQVVYGAKHSVIPLQHCSVDAYAWVPELRQCVYVEQCTVTDHVMDVKDSIRNALAQVWSTCPRHRVRRTVPPCLSNCFTKQQQQQTAPDDRSDRYCVYVQFICVFYAGGGHWLVWMEWRPAGWSVCLPLLIFLCTIKSRSYLLAQAHPGGPGKGP